MKRLFLLLFLFSTAQVNSQSLINKSKGWLIFFDETGLYFPIKNGERVRYSLDFLKVKERTNGVDLNMGPEDIEKYKKLGQKIPGVSFSYGGELRTITILPVKYKRVVTERTKSMYRNTTKDLKQIYTKFEIMYDQKKYLIGYSFFDSSYITDIVPLLKFRECKK